MCCGIHSVFPVIDEPHGSSHACLFPEQAQAKTHLAQKTTHVLVIDEVVYENYTLEQVNLFFQLVNARYEHGAIIITINKLFGRWSEIMSNETIATSTLDRLLHHAHNYLTQGRFVPYER